MIITGALGYVRDHQAKISFVIAQHPLNLVLNVVEGHLKNQPLRKLQVLGDNLNTKINDYLKLF